MLTSTAVGQSLLPPPVPGRRQDVALTTLDAGVYRYTDSMPDTAIANIVTEESMQVVGVPMTCVAQLVKKTNCRKIPITSPLFCADAYRNEEEYIAHVHEVCSEGFSDRSLSRSQHVAVAKEFIATKFPSEDEINAKVAKLRESANNYDTGTFDTSKNTVGGYNYTTRFFNHLMKLFYMLACLQKASDSCAVTRKRKLEKSLEDDEEHSQEEKSDICLMWGDRWKVKTLDWGMKAIMKAHITYMNAKGDMQFVCAMMIMNEAVFNSRLPKYDLKSLVDIAICYDNVCNWFNYIETNKISQGDFVAPEHQAVFNQIMTSALDNPIIPQYIRDEYKFYMTADDSGAPNKKVIASDRVTSTRKRMLARWNAYTAKFGVAAKAYPTHGGRKAVEESRSSR
jgi:hypothetical protein